MKTQNYLVTGGAGFIGSHLVRELLDAGHSVTVLDNLSTGRMANIDAYRDHPRFRFAIDTITNEVVLDRLASDADVIVHLAAAVGVQLIVEQPVHTIETNVMGTELLLRAALRYRARVLLASTSEVYGKGVDIPFREEDDVLLGPTTRNRWGYAASKMIDEFLGLAYWSEYGLPVTVTRFFNTVGPGQTGRYGMVVPRFVSQAIRGEDLTVFGDGTQRRCFCDVRDVVRALVALAETGEAAGQVVNIGGDEEISIGDLAQKVIDRTGSSSGIRRIPYSEAYAPGFEDMQRRVPALDKIRELIGWEREYDLDRTLDAVAEVLRDDPSLGARA